MSPRPVWCALAVCCLLLTSLPGFAAEPSPKTLGAAAEEVAKQIKAGAFVTAEQQGATPPVFAAAGKLEPSGVPPEKVIFEIGSISKVFNALLLAQAVVEGKVKLETTLSSLLPPGQRYDDPRVAAITMRQFATHTSGFPRLPPNLDEGARAEDPYAHYDRARLLEGVARTRLAGEGPYDLSYSNFGAGLLGDLLAQVYGKKWETLVVEKITGPLGMVDTVVTLNAEQRKRFAPPYAGADPAHTWDLNSLVAAGGLHSTAADLLKFGAAFLAPEKTPFAPALALVMQPQTKSGEIGLGIFRGGKDESMTYNHAGGTGGYGSMLEIQPATRRIRVVLANNSQAAPGRVIAAAQLRRETPVEGKQVLTEAELNAFTGVYRLDDLTRFTIVRRGKELWSRLTGQPFFQIYPEEKADRFFYKVVPAALEFTRDGATVASLTLFQNGQEMRGKRMAAAPEIRFPTQQELNEYAGVYAFGPGVSLTVTVQSETLYVQLTGQGAAPVFATRPDYFEADVVTAAFEFERDKGGPITALKLHQNGAVQKAAKAK